MSDKDDRYRTRQDAAAISEALWQVAKEYGITDRLAVDEQAALARTLANVLRRRSGPLTRSDILGAYETFELRRPPNGYAAAVIARLERLDREWDPVVSQEPR